MSRQKIGYRIRGVHNGKFVYAQYDPGKCRYVWSNEIPRPSDNSRSMHAQDAASAKEKSIDERGQSIEVTDVKIVAVYLRTEKAKPVATWPKNSRPGERVLLLASQGFRAVGRSETAKEAENLAESSIYLNHDDADAIGVLRMFRSNELADLPFPIRDFLGIDEHGCFWNADQKRDAELHAVDMKRMGYVEE
jgi:hypothetical protein